MTTFTELLEPTKSEKHGAFIFTTGQQSDYSPHAGVLTIMGSRCYSVFNVEEFPCDHGRGFMLFKVTPGSDTTESQYSVFVGSDDVGQCECKGFTAHGRCKHLACIGELLKAGRI